MFKKVLSNVSAVNHCPVFDEEVCRTSNHSTCVIFAGQIHDKQLNDESPVVTVV